jgi:hypothetical protein
VFSLTDGVVPMLHAARVTVSRIGPSRDVPGRNDTWEGQASLITHNAVVDRQAGPNKPLRVGNDTDSDHGHIGINNRTVVQSHHPQPPVSLKRFN